MPILSCYIDDDLFRVLQMEARDRQRGETAEDLAEAAISNAAIDARREQRQRAASNAG